MDIEQLKLILEMASAAGEGASVLVVAYLVVGLIKGFITPTAFVVICIIAAKLARYFIDQNNECTRKVKIDTLEWYANRYPHCSSENAEEALRKAGSKK